MNPSPRATILEICTASLDDVLIAQSAGADRVELNSALSLGGLTPLPGTVEMVVEQATVPVIAMARPRESGFHYSPHEFRAMAKDARWLLNAGVQGIAFGVLDRLGGIDIDRCREMVALIGDDRDRVFHRAFDLVADRQLALRQLIDCGVSRIMTSGGHKTAWQGRDEIRSLVAMARDSGDSIEIIPAGGIRPDHVEQFLRHTGASQVHAGLGKWHSDAAWPSDSEISFYGSNPENPAHFRKSCEQTIRQMIQCLPQAP